MEITSDLAEICGIHAGDGYMRLRERGKGEVDISGHLEEKDYYDKHVIPLFNKVFGLNITGKEFSRGSYGFVSYNKQLRETLMKLGFPSGEKSNIVSVPKLILESNNKEFYSRFLRGWFDTDGNLYFSRRVSGNYCDFKKEHNYYPVIQIATVSERLSKEVSFMLNELAVKHFIFSYQPKDIRDKRKYVITINGIGRLERWMELIGIKNPVKFTRYLIWKKFGFCQPHTTLDQRKDILNGKLDIYSVIKGL